MLLAITADTWIVTGLGFGIVLILLFCLVFILLFFGWIMQQIEKRQHRQPTTLSTKPKAAQTDDTAAIAMALYLADEAKKKKPGFASQARDTAWNFKSIGFNNTGF